ncbi:MAG: protease inhibitor I42 family protein [Burkholderiales bacterium]|nr:protease inhibitor I42 family protein [Burkholderiales bacterium]
MNKPHRTDPKDPLARRSCAARRTISAASVARPVWLPLSLSLCVALLAACGTTQKAAPAAVPAVVSSPGQAVVTVSERQSGASVVLEPTQALVVKLPNDVTSVRDWALIDLQPGVLALQRSTFENAAPRPLGDEYVGTAVWRFVPQAAGTVTLTFELRRPHRVGPAAQTVTYRVTVK